MHQRIPAVQPAVHCTQAIHQPLGRGAVIRFSGPELIIVQPCLQALSVNPLVGQFAQGSLYNGKEFTLLFPVCIFCNHGKIRLEDAAVISSQDILPDSRIDQRLL